MKTLKLLLANAFLILVSDIAAQTTAIIRGNVIDEKGAPMLFVPIALMDDTLIIGGTTTDMNGDFTIKDIVPGLYNIKTIYMGYNTSILKDVRTNANKICYLTITLQPATNVLKPIVVSAEWDESILNPVTETLTRIDIDQIKSNPSEKGDIIALVVNFSPAVIPTEDGKDIHIRGSRRGTTGYYVDGNKMIGPAEVPGMCISGIEVLTGGMPAEYGDCTGGLVIISTTDYKVEMRRKQIARTARKENEEVKKSNKKKRWLTIE